MRCYDVVPVSEGAGGSLIVKGAPPLLEPSDKACAWSSLALSLSDGGHPVFSVGRGGVGGEWALMGRTRLPPDTWCHVAVSTSPSKIAIYVNGVEDAAQPTPADLLEVRLTN